ncbi:hypothetical protein FRC06_006758 [Ceratobasidium sp. 370]|nr:hypothetical protein FRC06_006758 [Ceratobasidium sp. 370]
MASRYSDASSLYSQSELTHEDDRANPPAMSQRRSQSLAAPTPTRAPLVPRRSSQRLSVRPVSGVPTPVRRESNSPDTPVAGASTSLLPHSGSSSRTDSPRAYPDTPRSDPDTPRTSTLLLGQPAVSFRPLSSVYPSQGQPRKGFPGARDSSSGYPVAIPSRSSKRVPPQPAFLLPPENDTAFLALRAGSTTDLNDLDRYIGTAPDGHKSVTRLDDSYSFDPDPMHWGTKHLALNDPEPDDELHNPDPRRDRTYDKHVAFSVRGLINVGCLVFVLAALLTLL